MVDYTMLFHVACSSATWNILHATGKRVQKAVTFSAMTIFGTCFWMYLRLAIIKHPLDEAMPRWFPRELKSWHGNPVE
jgi:hypothetical protein